jgi:hypothetical protein
LRVPAPTGSKAAKLGVRTEAQVGDARYAEAIARYETLRESAVAAFGLKDLDAQLPLAHARQATSKKPKAAPDVS